MLRDPAVVAETSAKTLVFEAHIQAAQRLGDKLEQMCELQRAANELRHKLYSQKAQSAPGGAFVLEVRCIPHEVLVVFHCDSLTSLATGFIRWQEAAEPFAFKRRLAASTVAVLQSKLTALESQLSALKKACGEPADLVQDLIKNELVVAKK